MGVAAAQIRLDHKAGERLRVSRGQAGRNKGTGDKALDPLGRDAGAGTVLLRHRCHVPW